VTRGPAELLLVSTIVAGAAMVKGAIGFGFPLIGVPLVSIVLGPRAAVPVIAIPTLLSNVILITRSRPSGRAGPFVVVLAALAVGTVTGALLIKALDARVLSVLVGATTLLYVAATALRLTVLVPPAVGTRAAPFVGFAAGAMGGATGIFAPLLVSYLHLLRLAKREFVFWITVMFSVSNVAQVASYFHLGLYAGPVLGTALVTCLPMAAGTWLGLALQDRLNQEAFGRAVLAIVFLASLNLLVRGLLG
jgi:uncharacterized membrane protein YfcA